MSKKIVKLTNSCLSVEEMENLGWLEKPAAKVFYLNNSKIQRQYSTYDDYAFFCYASCKGKWSHASISNVTESTTNTSSNYTGGLSADRVDPATTLNSYEFDITTNKKPKKINKFNNYSEESVKQQGNIQEITFIKAKKAKRNTTNYRQLHKVCPECGSSLQLNESNVWECSNDKLKLWEVEFVKFEKLNDSERENYLKKISDKSKFFELYKMWEYKDEHGSRVNFQCIFDTKLFNPVSRFRTSLSDPALVKTIEQSLGKKLTEQELLGESEIWKEGNSYFRTYKKGRKKVKIPQLIFPDAFI